MIKLFDTRFAIENLAVHACLYQTIAETDGNSDSVLHFHSNYELQYIRQGEFMFELENERFTVGEYSLVIIPPGVFHKVYPVGDGRRTACSISFRKKSQGQDAFSRYAEPFLHIHRIVYYNYVMEELIAINSAIKSSTHTPEWEKRHQVNALLTIALGKIADLLRTTRDNAIPDNETEATGNKNLTVMLRVANLISNHYAESLTIRDAAEYCFLSPRQVERILRQNGNKTFTTLLNEQRVQAAKRLISTTELSLDAISQSCGFENYSTFWKNFHRVTGIAPGEYRRSRL